MKAIDFNEMKPPSEETLRGHESAFRRGYEHGAYAAIHDAHGLKPKEIDGWLSRLRKWRFEGDKSYMQTPPPPRMRVIREP